VPAQDKSNQPPLIIFVSSVLLVVFIIGGVMAINNLPPFSFLQKNYHATVALLNESQMVRPKILREQRYDGNGVVEHKAEQTSAGVTILQGIFADGVQLRLVDMDGNILHAWPIDFFKIWPEPTHLEKNKIPKSSYHYHSQGNAVLPDGSIIVNIGYKGTAKLDKCGKVLWTVDRMTRHFVNPTEGGYWIGANRAVDDIPEELLFFGVERSWLKTTFERYENTILLIDESGNIRDEFSLLQAFYDAGLEGHIYDAMKIARDDPTHNNDIEEVTAPLANKIEGVNEGDLLVSIRNMHMLIILDKETKEIKWTYSGSWTRQHDPDITPDGNIIVFNNSLKKYGFNREPGSNLVEFDPATRKSTVVYPKVGQPGMWASIFGTHQALENGNILISEGQAGRVIEINSKGDIVWSYVSKYDDSHASAIEAAHRYDSDYFEVDDWSCD
jgi:hypothetical protein